MASRLASATILASRRPGTAPWQDYSTRSPDCLITFDHRIRVGQLRPQFFLRRSKQHFGRIKPARALACALEPCWVIGNIMRDEIGDGGRAFGDVLSVEKRLQKTWKGIVLDHDNRTICHGNAGVKLGAVLDYRNIRLEQLKKTQS